MRLIASVFASVTAVAMPWLAPLAPVLAAVRAIVTPIVEALARMRITLNGLAVLGLFVAAIIGGWVGARHIRANERARIAALERAAIMHVNGQLDVLIGVRTGAIAADDARLNGISAELKRIVAQIPPETITVAVPSEPVMIPVPSLIALPSAPAPRARSQPAARAAPAVRGADYPAALREKLDQININIGSATGGHGGAK